MTEEGELSTVQLIVKMDAVLTTIDREVRYLGLHGGLYGPDSEQIRASKRRGAKAVAFYRKHIEECPPVAKTGFETRFAKREDDLHNFT